MLAKGAMMEKSTDHFLGESEAKIMVTEMSTSAPNSKASSDVSSTNNDAHILSAPTQADVTSADSAGSTAAPSGGLNLLLAASRARDESRSAAETTVPSAVNIKKEFGSDWGKVVKADAESIASTAAYNSNHFPRLLHEILITPEYQPIIHWLPDGLSFFVADKKRLESEILPKYFRRALSSSFVRKLNRWGFRRVKSRNKGEDSSFAHDKFVRDKPWLCLKMKCKSTPNPDRKFCSTFTSATDKRNNKTKNLQHSKTSRLVSAKANPIPHLLAAHPSTSGHTTSIQAYSSVSQPRFAIPYPHGMLPAMGSLSGIAPSGIQGSQFVASNQSSNEVERQRLVANLRHLHDRRQSQLQADLQHLRMTMQLRQQLANNIRLGGQSTTNLIQIAQYHPLLREHAILRSGSSSNDNGYYRGKNRQK